MLRGIGKYSEVRSELGKHITDPRFAEVFLCEPTRRYRVAGVQRSAAPQASFDAKPVKAKK